MEIDFFEVIMTRKRKPARNDTIKKLALHLRKNILYFMRISDLGLLRRMSNKLFFEEIDQEKWCNKIFEEWDDDFNDLFDWSSIEKAEELTESFIKTLTGLTIYFKGGDKVFINDDYEE